MAKYKRKYKRIEPNSRFTAEELLRMAKKLYQLEKRPSK